MKSIMKEQGFPYRLCTLMILKTHSQHEKLHGQTSCGCGQKKIKDKYEIGFKEVDAEGLVIKTSQSKR